jgi:hypothetical protein
MSNIGNAGKIGNANAKRFNLKTNINVVPPKTKIAPEKVKLIDNIKTEITPGSTPDMTIMIQMLQLNKIRIFAVGLKNKAIKESNVSTGYCLITVFS